jgi:hypothetical protein
MNIWRIAGIAFVAGLTLFLLSIVIKLVLVAAVTLLLIRVVGARLASRYINSLGRSSWEHTEIISIDNPAYRAPMTRANYERVIPIG